ncbi:hypothetical protein BC829DRAFT_393090 [Chytridium lagenaria]|nr:hypothetical protein BC829DRAFT_393090 [Chytridium lagenaria]
MESSPSKSRARDRLCRYVIIHGFCKFEKQGCEFIKSLVSSTSSPELKSRLRVDSPIFTPIAEVSGDIKPSSSKDFESGQASTSAKKFGTGSDTPTPSSYGIENNYAHPTMNYSPYAAPDYPSIPTSQSSPQQLRSQMTYHVHTPPLPHVSNMHPHQKQSHAFFMSETFRDDLRRRNADSFGSFETAETSNIRLPQELHVYHSFRSLDAIPDHFSKLLGYSVSYYKTISSKDGKPYTLLRLHGFRLSNEAAMSAVDSWRKISHPNVICLREAFTTKAFGDHSLVFVYDYFPLYPSLFSKHLAISQSAPVPEKILWSYVIQIASGLKSIHSSGLAARVLEPTKVILTGKNRVRLSCVGVIDMLTYDSSVKSIAQLQHDDLSQFGQLLLTLAFGSLSAIHNIPKALEYISRNFSADFKNVILYLLGKSQTFKAVDDLITMIGPRLVNEINSIFSYRDLLETELSRETENGRLVRLLSKMNLSGERPEYDADDAWSELGQFYPLKLFRNYVFHQVDDMGNPVLDLGYILQCLNKPDNNNCIIATFQEIKQLTELAFQRLKKHDSIK